MAYELTEVILIESRADYTLHELVDLSGLPHPVVQELVDCGVLSPGVVATSPHPATMHFEAENIVLARAASRLREHFELEHEGLAVAVSLLKRVRRLERRLAEAGGR